MCEYLGVKPECAMKVSKWESQDAPLTDLESILERFE